MIDSAPRGAIALHHLKAIASGQTTNTLVSLESDIDTALLWNHRLQEESLRLVVEPILGFDLDANRKYLTRLADYRRDHASPLGPEAVAKPEPQSEKDREFRTWLIEGARQNQAIISQMVERYATKPPQSP